MKYGQKKTVVSIGNFDDEVSELSVYEKNNKGDKLVEVFHKKFTQPQCTLFEKTKKVTIITKRKF